ncbi:hypothetical protein JTB14_029171 [Gonioctena quinquepunctata]|nr:hypothetical protein JTB14_029171 [Gonioctena quinquepunctata]
MKQLFLCYPVVLTNRLNLLKAKLKNSRKTSARRKMKVKTLSQVIREINRKFALSKEATLALEASVSGTLSALVRRMITNSKIRKKKEITKQTFPAELRGFAMTLQFYSSKAYKYVRKTFNLALPVPATISIWLSKIDCSLGFAKQSIDSIRNKSEDFKRRCKKTLLCA